MKKLFLLAGAAVNLSSFSVQAIEDELQDPVATTVSTLRDAYKNNALIIDEKSGKRLRVTSLMDLLLIPLEDETLVCHRYGHSIWKGFAYGRREPAVYDNSVNPPRLISSGIQELFSVDLKEDFGGGEEKKEENKEKKKKS